MDSGREETSRQMTEEVVRLDVVERDSKKENSSRLRDVDQCNDGDKNSMRVTDASK